MGLFTQSSAEQRSTVVETRLARVERKLDLIIEHLAIEVPDRLSPQVREAVNRGSKIEAIKLYREETGAGLLDAKNVIEAEY